MARFPRRTVLLCLGLLVTSPSCKEPPGRRPQPAPKPAPRPPPPAQPAPNPIDENPPWPAFGIYYVQDSKARTLLVPAQPTTHEQPRTGEGLWLLGRGGVVRADFTTLEQHASDHCGRAAMVRRCRVPSWDADHLVVVEARRYGATGLELTRVPRILYPPLPDAQADCDCPEAAHRKRPPADDEASGDADDDSACPDVWPIIAEHPLALVGGWLYFAVGVGNEGCSGVHLVKGGLARGAANLAGLAARGWSRDLCVLRDGHRYCGEVRFGNDTRFTIDLPRVGSALSPKSCPSALDPCGRVRGGAGWRWTASDGASTLRITKGTVAVQARDAAKPWTTEAELPEPLVAVAPGADEPARGARVGGADGNLEDLLLGVQFFADATPLRELLDGPRRRGPSFSIPTSFTRTYLGRIGKVPVRLTLTRAGDRLTGKASYGKRGGQLVLEGQIDSRLGVAIGELHREGYPQAVLAGAFVSPSRIEGSWSNLPGTRVQPFSLEEQTAAPAPATP